MIGGTCHCMEVYYDVVIFHERVEKVYQIQQGLKTRKRDINIHTTIGGLYRPLQPLHYITLHGQKVLASFGRSNGDIFLWEQESTLLVRLSNLRLSGSHAQGLGLTLRYYGLKNRGTVKWLTRLSLKDLMDDRPSEIKLL